MCEVYFAGNTCVLLTEDEILTLNFKASNTFEYSYWRSLNIAESDPLLNCLFFQGWNLSYFRFLILAVLKC